jgi:arylsulfatase A-like enzyme
MLHLNASVTTPSRMFLYTGPRPVTTGPHDAPPHAGQVVRRVLLRRNIVIDAETARLGFRPGLRGFSS